MIEIARIVCGVDFSDASRHALLHAATLARWYEATLTVLHVHRAAIPAAALAPGLGAMGVDSVLLMPPDQGRLLENLRTFVVEAGVGDVKLDVRLLEGDTANGIAEEAAATRADVIVVGTHGRSGFERFVLGSVAEKLLQIAPCTVLTVPPGAADAPAPPLFSRILVATDFSDASQRAVGHALSLAVEAAARLTVMHVVEVPRTSAEPAYTTHDLAPVFREIREAAAAHLLETVPPEVHDWCKVTERLESGRPYREILRVAADEHAGLIVLGAHGHGALDRFFFGSTAQHVVRRATCPVMAVRL